MSNKRSQTELERPAKVYEIMALETQIKSLNDQIQRMNTSMDTLISNSKGQIRPEELASNLSALRITFENQLAEEVEKIHLEYSPIKRANSKFLWMLVAAGIAMLGQLMYTAYIVG